MSSSNIPIIKFLFRTEYPVLNETLNVKPVYESEEIPSANDLASFVTTVPAALIITSLKEKEDLLEIATFMKIVKKVAKDSIFKIVVINFSGDKNLEKAIAKLGIQDSVEPGINTRGLKFKIDFWMKSLNVQVKNNPSSQLAKTTNSSDVKGEQELKVSNSNLPVWEAPLELEDDIWILKNDQDCKKILSKWLIRLLGPAPFIGQWIEVKAGIWRFEIKEEDKEMYVPNDGAWYFSGDQKPEFVWKENRWLISGDNFNLFFKNQSQTFSRLSCSNKIFKIAKNSLFANTKETIILESLDKELVFKQEAANLQDLEGKGNTDQLGSGHLSGKNKSSDSLSGNLSGELEGTEPSLEGALKNKSKYSEEGDKDPLGLKSENLSKAKNLEREIKDSNHKKYYKNHNEAEKHGSGNLTGKNTSENEKLDAFYRQKNLANDRTEENEEDEQSEALPLEENLKDVPVKRQKAISEPRTSGVTDQEIAALEEKLKAIEQRRKKNQEQKTPGQHDEEEQERAEAAIKEKIAALKHGKAPGESRSKDSTDKITSHYKTKLALVPEEEAADEEKTLKELTSETKVSSYLIQNGTKVTCHLDDYFDDTIIFKTDQVGIKALASANLDMIFNYLEKDSKLKFATDILAVDDDGEGSQYITLKIDKGNTLSLGVFMRLFEIRQENINQFLKKAKGY